MNTSNQFQNTFDLVLDGINKGVPISTTAQLIKSSYCDNGYFKIDMGVDLAEIFKQCVAGLNSESAAYCAKVMAKCFS